MTITTRRVAGPAGLASTLVLFAACAAAAPNERMASSNATIRAAQEVGASHVPQAALHLQLAREQAERAKGLTEKGGSDELAQADGLLMRAQADADLALALAREEVDRAQAQKTVDSLK